MPEHESINERYADSLRFFQPFARAIENKLGELKKPGDSFVFGCSRMGNSQRAVQADLDMRRVIANVNLAPASASSLGPVGAKVSLEASPDGQPYFKFGKNDSFSNMDTSLDGVRFSRGGLGVVKPSETIYLSFQGVALKITAPRLDNWDTAQYRRTETLTADQIEQLRLLVENLEAGNERNFFELKNYLPAKVKTAYKDPLRGYSIHHLGTESWSLVQVREFLDSQSQLQANSAAPESTLNVEAPDNSSISESKLAESLRNALEGVIATTRANSPEITDQQLRELLPKVMTNVIEALLPTQNEPSKV